MQGNPQHALKDKGVIDSVCSRYMTGNMSYLFDFEELNGRYVSFGGNPKDGKISTKGKIRTGKFDGKVDDGFLVGYSNNNGDAAFDGNEPEKPESEVNVSLRSSTQSRKQDDKTKKEAKGKISTVRQNYPNNTNTFSAVGPLTAAAGPTYGKYSFVDASQLLDDPDMPELEDITYSDDEDDVGAEADFNNLETSITVSPIPTSRIHKDHSVTQIIGDLSSTTQTKSMTRVVKDQCGLSQMFNDDFHTWFEGPDHPDKVYKVVKALYGLHQAPRAWYETLANYLLENDFKRGKIDQTLFIKRQKGNILLVQIYVDDIIFGATNKVLCKSFEKLMKDKFQMSSIGEPTFFLGLQVKQKKDGIFISKDKYVAEILRKFRLA
nr:putative ribonuclease H-like domain-containing protein [Tanacetum cinerariifolium]